MTPKELHDLYNGPFTMPDGSKRRALWEREPATKPELGVLWRAHTEEVGSLAAVNAMCRVAVEDFIIASVGGVCISDEKNVFALPCNDPEYLNGGPTVHHALVASAHMILDEKGVPR